VKEESQQPLSVLVTDKSLLTQMERHYPEKTLARKSVFGTMAYLRESVDYILFLIIDYPETALFSSGS